MKPKTWIFYIAGLALALFRCVVIQNAIEPETGFYVKGHMLPPIFSAALLLALAAAVIYSALVFKKKFPVDPDKLRGGSLSAAAYAFLGAGLAVCAVYYFSKAVAGTGDISIYLFFLMALAAAAAAFSMFLAAPYHSTGKKPSGLMYMQLMPVIWFSLSLINTFRGYTTILTISDYLFETFMMVAVTAFSLFAAKMYLGAPSVRALHIWGLCAWIGICVTVVPNYYFEFISAAGVFTSETVPDMLPIFTLLLLIPVTLKAAAAAEDRN